MESSYIDRLKTKFKKEKTKNLLFYIAILAFPITQFLVFYIGVNFNSILLAFRGYDIDQGKFYWNGLDNFVNVFSDFRNMALFEIAFKNSIIAFLFGLVFGILFGLLFSYYIYKKLFGHRLFKVVLFIPSIVSSIVMVTIFMQFVESGIPNIIQQIFGIRMMGLLANSDLTFTTILFYNVWIGFGVSTLLYVGAMNSINVSIIESAQIDGVNTIQEFRHIIMPLIWPTFTQFVVVSVGAIFMNQLSLYAFYGQGAEVRLYSFGYYLYKEVIVAANVDLPYLATIGIILTFVTVPITLAIKWALQKYGPSTE